MMAGLMVAALSLQAPPTDTVAFLATLEPNGWSYLSGGSDTAAFTRRAVQPANGYRRIWARFEYAKPQKENDYSPNKTYKSYVTLLEIDCSEAKERNLQSIYYPENNEAGGAIDVYGGGSNAQWSYVVPATYGESALLRICAKAEPSAAAASAGSRKTRPPPR